jgi:hypothetical protein
MKPFWPLVFLWLPALSAAAQSVPAPALKHELDSLLVVDQRYRELSMQASEPGGAKPVAATLGIAVPQVPGYLTNKMLQVDSANIRRIAQLMRQHGYPGKSLVGTPANEAAFYVIQHSNRIPQYLPLVKQAAQRGELPFRLYAMMLDRQLMNEGKEQVYGSQGYGFAVPDPATGTADFRRLIWPIKDPAGVNRRRQLAGFELTVEENAQRLGIPYQPLTLADVKKMRKP